MLADKQNQQMLQRRLQQMQLNQHEQDMDPDIEIQQDDIGAGQQEITSMMSSLNQGLLDEQKSNGLSQSFVEGDSYNMPNGEMSIQDIRNIKEAIIDLYLAIKIRSTDELDQINDDGLKDEKTKLMESVDCFQILEYIRSSIEIIMNLKIDDLEKNENSKRKEGQSGLPSEQVTSRGQETDVEGISVESKNLIQQSMKEALIHMVKTTKATKMTAKGEPPKEYEKIIQKLEADIRGHIRLEHEMKIHMDYLEAKVEKFEKEQKNVDVETSKLTRQMESLTEKLQLIRDDRDDKDRLNKKMKNINENLRSKMVELEQQNDHMTAKIAESFTHQAHSGIVSQEQSQSNLGTKQKFNSIDVGHDEVNFNNMNTQKNNKTNTHISSSQKRILQANGDPGRFAGQVQSQGSGIYQTLNRPNVNKVNNQQLSAQQAFQSQNSNNFTFSSNQSQKSNGKQKNLQKHQKSTSIQNLNQIKNAYPNQGNLQNQMGQKLLKTDNSHKKISASVGLKHSNSKSATKNQNLYEGANHNGQANPYLLDMNRQNQPAQNALYGNFNQNGAPNNGNQVLNSAHQQQQNPQLQYRSHQKSESMDVSGMGPGSQTQYKSMYNNNPQKVNYHQSLQNTHSMSQQQMRKNINVRDHNKSIGAMPNEQNSFLINEKGGIPTVSSHGLLSGLDTRAKGSIDSADLLQKNMQRNQRNTIEQEGQQHSTSFELGNLGHNRLNNNLTSSIQNLKQPGTNGIIINGKLANQAQIDKQNQQLRRQMIGNQGGLDMNKPQMSKQHATLVVRNQINIINNNQSQQIFSKAGFSTNPMNHSQGSAVNEYQNNDNENLSSLSLKAGDQNLNVAKNKQILSNMGQQQRGKAAVGASQGSSNSKLKRSGGSQQAITQSNRMGANVQQTSTLIQNQQIHQSQQQLPQQTNKQRKLSQSNQIQILLNQGNIGQKKQNDQQSKAGSQKRQESTSYQTHNNSQQYLQQMQLVRQSQQNPNHGQSLIVTQSNARQGQQLHPKQTNSGGQGRKNKMASSFVAIPGNQQQMLMGQALHPQNNLLGNSNNAQTGSLGSIGSYNAGITVGSSGKPSVSKKNRGTKGSQNRYANN